MPTSRPFAFNSGSTLPNTSQVGNVAIGTGSTLNYSGGYGGLEWWMGPDEDLGYIITYQANAQSSPVAGKSAKVQFWRSQSKTEASFIALATYISNFTQTFTTGTQASAWLRGQGYWDSFT